MNKKTGASQTMPKILFRFSLLFAFISLICYGGAEIAKNATDKNLGWILSGGLVLVVVFVLAILAPLIKGDDSDRI
jgi:hypothetical protein